jgi:hypothetical protein
LIDGWQWTLSHRDPLDDIPLKMPFEHCRRQNGAADAPQIRETSAVTGLCANHQRYFRRIRLMIVTKAMLVLPAILGFGGRMCVLMCTAPTHAGRSSSVMLVNECLCGDFRDQVGRRVDVILMCPGQLLGRRVATAMFPTLTCCCATARMMLARERHVRRFAGGRRQRDSECGN